MEENNKFKIIATTFAGMENILADELINLGCEEVTILKRAVSFIGNKRLLYKSNYMCRYALRILKPIFEFHSENEEDFYKAIKEFHWWEFLDIKDTFSIDTVAFNSHLEHTQYITLKAKDAIADCFTDKMNRRPYVDTENPKLRVNIHLTNNDCSISFDSSGDPLFKRGYRIFTNEAPINEVLAAGLIKLSEWDCQSNFMDPMCGSGTFLIEAAMFSQQIPSGYYRNKWGFMNWKDYDCELWDDIVNEANSNICEFDFHIIGSDISKRNINIAKENITRAKLHRDIKLEVTPIEEQEGLGNCGTVIINPPYGKRMKPEEIDSLYKSIGDSMKKNFIGYKFFIISSDFQALKNVGLKPFIKINVFNGPLECKFLGFDVYEGSKKHKTIDDNNLPDIENEDNIQNFNDQKENNIVKHANEQYEDRKSVSPSHRKVLNGNKGKSSREKEFYKKDDRRGRDNKNSSLAQPGNNEEKRSYKTDRAPKSNNYRSKNNKKTS